MNTKVNGLRIIPHLVSSAWMLLCSGAVWGQALPAYPTTAGTVTTSEWAVDRYAPANFANAGTLFGRENVLLLGVSEADGPGNRPPAQSSSFFDTQGRKLRIEDWGTPPMSFVGSLRVPSAWASSTGLADSRRTEMWGVLTPDGLTAQSNAIYAIIGFSNEGQPPASLDSLVAANGMPADYQPQGGGSGGLQIFDKDTGGFIPVGPPNFDQWNDFCVTFTGAALEYRIDGELVYTDNTIDAIVNDNPVPVDGFLEVIMQAKNYGERPTPPGGIAGVTYDSHWTNLGFGRGSCEDVIIEGEFSADLQLVKSVAPTLLMVGDFATFTLTATNNGPDPANQTQVVDTLPPQLAYVSNTCGATFAGGQLTWLIGDLAVGDSRQCDVVVQISAEGTYTNNAFVSAQQVDPIPANNPDVATVTTGIVDSIPVPSSSLTGLILLMLLLGAFGASAVVASRP